MNENDIKTIQTPNIPIGYSDGGPFISQAGWEPYPISPTNNKEVVLNDFRR